MKLAFVYIITLVSLLLYLSNEVSSNPMYYKRDVPKVPEKPKVKESKVTVPKVTDSKVTDPKVKDPKAKVADPKVPKAIVADEPGDFCKGKTISDGTQNRAGSCSLTIQGQIPSDQHMTSTLIVSPQNGQILEPNKEFDVSIVVNNLETGKFSDPEKQYYTQPQDVNSDGIIQGHTHITIQQLESGQPATPPNANEFAFFKGINDPAQEGKLSVQVTNGLPEGNYRICTLSSTFTHQPLLMPVAKRGAQDDCIRIGVSVEN